MLKVWIAGAGGQVGMALNEILDPLEIEVFNTDKSELDITDADAVLNFGEMGRPDVIINCAALTDPNACEENPEEAFRVNALGARNLSLAARKVGAKIVQMSTDDVFDGRSAKPYGEFDDTNPTSVYGRSKRAGENYVKEFTHKHFIIRSSWVFGHGNNFVNEVLRHASVGQELCITANEFGSSTSACDLARLMLHLIATNEYGTYHVTCSGTCSRYEFAQEILRLAGMSLPLKEEPLKPTEGFAKRPAYGVLDNFILRIIKIYEMPDWKTSLQEYMNHYKEELEWEKRTDR